MEHMKLPAKQKCWALFIFSCNIYMDLLEGAPSKTMGVEGCDNLKRVAKQLFKWGSLHIHEHLKESKEMLSYRRNIALIVDAHRKGMVIRFDDGKLDARNVIASIINRIGFDTMTKEYSL